LTSAPLTFNLLRAAKFRGSLMDFLHLLDSLSNLNSDDECVRHFEKQFHEFEPTCAFYCCGSPIAGSGGLKDKISHGKTAGRLVDDEIIMTVLADPALQAADKFPEYCKNNTSPLIWECDPTAMEDKDEKRFFGLAADFGVTGGITIPIHQLNKKTYGNLTLFFQQEPRLWLKRLTRVKKDIHVASLYLDAKLSSEPKPLPTGFNLSPRERDCLALLAIGLHTSQIADRLVLSDPTVNEYISNARKKLSARTRSEAVARAVQYELISL